MRGKEPEFFRDIGLIWTFYKGLLAGLGPVTWLLSTLGSSSLETQTPKSLRWEACLVPGKLSD